jgi:hypothetical protein
MIVLEANKSIMRLKFKESIIREFYLLIGLFAASAIMRSKVFMHRWLIFSAKN